jgi:hypothetical protein
MRVLIRVDSSWTVSYSASTAPDWTPAVRRLERMETRGGAIFPLPPLDERRAGDTDAGSLGAGSPQALEAAYAAITSRDPGPGGIERFGRFLFDTLLGERLWREIETLSADAPRLELALSWDRYDAHLHRLNWEMMHGPAAFLAASVPKPVAITRLVQGATGLPRPLSRPPRVLFLIGSSLTDRRIKAGAEFFGMLRQIERDGRSIHTRIVERTSTERAIRVIKAFRPDVVHVIGHGGFSAGEPYLEFELNERETNPAERRVYADRLKDVLSARGEVPLPAIVVLSACHSGGATAGRLVGGHETAPLAAQLVALGVPVVIGMAGSISDRACRHFTRRFGQTLVRGDALIAATEEGRRAAFASGSPPAETVDWALPTVHLSESVGEDYRPAVVEAESQDPAVLLESRIQQFGGERNPVFCGRGELIDTYYRLFDPGAPRVLAAYSEGPDAAEIGRSRLLAELVGQAVRDGHLPCLVDAGAVGAESCFPNALALGLAILASITRTRAVFGLDAPLDSVLVTLCRNADPSSFTQLVEQHGNLPADMAFTMLLEHCRKRCTGLDIPGSAVAQAVRRDLASLIEDGRRAHAYVAEARGQAVVMFDDVERYDLGILALFQELLSPSGLGDPQTPVPVVVVFRLGTAADALLRPAAVQNAKPWLMVRRVEAFPDGEDLLACHRVLLHPCEGDRTPLAVNEQADEATQDLWRKIFRANVRGLPVKFRSMEFYNTAEVAREDGYLIEADDERLLREDLQAGRHS